MTEILALTHSFVPYLSKTSLRQLRQIILAMLCIPGRITTQGLSRWTEQGGSHRTLHRWFHSPIDWTSLLWALIRVHLLDPQGEYFLAGDDVVVSKAGKHTHGLGRFYSSLAQRAIPSLSFFVVSLIDVNARRSYPLQIEQHLPSPRAKSSPPPPKRPRGRPKGSKNHVKTPPPLTPELARIERTLQACVSRIAMLKVKWLVLDGFFGTFPTTSMVLGCGLHLISKLRHNAALYLPYTGPKPARGATPRYGEKLNYGHLPPQARCHTTTTGGICTETYHLQVLHKDFQEALNVAIVVKTHLKTGKRGHVIFFSTDLALTAAQLVDYYSLRFQIEFNFRDAKQFWGLEDFMNISAQAVTNAVNLAFLMVNLSAVMLRDPHRRRDGFSVFDLKNHFRAHRYLTETIKCLPVFPDQPLISRLWNKLTALGGIRTHSTSQFSP
jgi:putative transposase